MKKVKKNLLLGIAASIALNSPSWAQHLVGNGGNGNEPQFTSLANEILTWVKANQDLELLEKKLGLAQVGISPQDFSKRLKEAVASTRVKFSDEQIIIAGEPRPCGNFKNPNLILCDNAAWTQASMQAHYSIVFHEYLGVIGLENNEGSYSKYPISSRIISYVYTADKKQLGLEKISPDCLGDLCVGNRVANRIDGATGTLRAIDRLGGLAAVEFDFPSGNFPRSSRLLIDNIIAIHTPEMRRGCLDGFCIGERVLFGSEKRPGILLGTSYEDNSFYLQIERDAIAGDSDFIKVSTKRLQHFTERTPDETCLNNLCPGMRVKYLPDGKVNTTATIMSITKLDRRLVLFFDRPRPDYNDVYYVDERPENGDAGRNGSLVQVVSMDQVQVVSPDETPLTCVTKGSLGQFCVGSKITYDGSLAKAGDPVFGTIKAIEYGNETVTIQADDRFWKPGTSTIATGITIGQWDISYQRQPRPVRSTPEFERPINRRQFWDPFPWWGRVW